LTVKSSVNEKIQIKPLKQMAMKTKKKSEALAILRLIMVLPVIALLIVAFSSCGREKSSGIIPTEMMPPPPPPPPPPEVAEAQDSVYQVVDEMPRFPGGDAALLKLIGDSVRYPEVAKQNGTQGKVIVRFCVTEKGSINHISIIKGVSPEIDAESIRVVAKLPDFKPGKQGGKEVPVWYHVPINYTLQ
jgi:TonB family protein